MLKWFPQKKKNSKPREGVSICREQCRSMGRGRGGGARPPKQLWQARWIWSAATLFTLLFGSMCSFRFDKASKLFIYSFNKENLPEINALRRLERYFRDHIVQNLPGEHAPGPRSSSCLRRLWLLPPLNESNLTTTLRENAVSSFLGCFKTLSIGPAPGIESTTSLIAVNRSTDWSFLDTPTLKARAFFFFALGYKYMDEYASPVWAAIP